MREIGDRASGLPTMLAVTTPLPFAPAMASFTCVRTLEPLINCPSPRPFCRSHLLLGLRELCPHFSPRDRENFRPLGLLIPPTSQCTRTFRASWTAHRVLRPRTPHSARLLTAIPLTCSDWKCRGTLFPPTLSNGTSRSNVKSKRIGSLRWDTWAPRARTCAKLATTFRPG